MAINGRDSGTLGMQRVLSVDPGSLHCTGVFHSVLTRGVADVWACTTEGDLRDEGFNSECHLNPMGSP